MIEVSDRKYWRELNYHDGVLYCELLDIDGKNDWRMIKDMDEWYDITNIPHGWFFDDIYDDNYYYFAPNYVIPVRDA